MKRIVDILLKTSRWKVQLGMLMVLNASFIPWLNPWLKRIPCTTLHCHACPAATFACPIGSLQNSGTLRAAPFYVLGILGITGVLVGRLSCGWFCPFGFLQDQLHRIKTPKFEFNYNIGWIRYAVLILLVGIVPIITNELWFCKLCPAGTLEAGIPRAITEDHVRSQIGWFFGLTIVMLAALLGAMIVIKRPFCRFVCPLGAIYSPFNRHSVMQLEVDHQSCIKCGQCQDVCPVDIDITEDANSYECIRCLECAKVCPVSAIGYRETKLGEVEKTGV